MIVNIYYSVLKNYLIKSVIVFDSNTTQSGPKNHIFHGSRDIFYFMISAIQKIWERTKLNHLIFDAGAGHAADNEMMEGADGVEVNRAGPVLVVNDGNYMKAFSVIFDTLDGKN